VEILPRQDDVAPLVEFVAFDDLGVGHLAIAVRAPALLLDARLTLAVQLIERDRPARFGRREHLDGDVHQADLEETFPGRTCCHGVFSYRTQSGRPKGLRYEYDTGLRYERYASSRSSCAPRSRPVPVK